MSALAWEMIITWGCFLLFCVCCALYQKADAIRHNLGTIERGADRQHKAILVSEPSAVAEHILISAVRHALGRQTYIVPMTVQEVVRLWPDLTADTRDIIRRDVTEALPRCSDMDQREWQQIVEL